ncbi:MAG: hypothetical protein WBV73_28215 [Phormidium sp.]
MFTLKKLGLAALTFTAVEIVSIAPAQAFTLYFSPSVSPPLNLFGIGAGSITIDDSVTNLQLGQNKTFTGTISSGMATGEYHTYSVTKTPTLTVSLFARSDTWNFGSWKTAVTWQMNIFCNVANISSCEGAQGHFFSRSVTPYGDPFYEGMVTFHTSPVNKPPISSIPEPQTVYALLSLGVLGLLERKWKVISAIIN